MHQIYLTSLHEVTVPEKLKIEIDLNDFVEEEGVAGGDGGGGGFLLMGSK